MPRPPWALLVCLLATPAWAQRLTITTTALPTAMYGTPYRLQLEAEGGVPPLRWEVAGGRLPAGLVLDRATGVLQGVPGAEGEFVFAVRVSDSTQPPQMATRTFAARVTRPMAVEWTAAPYIQGSGVYGSLRVWNRTGFDVDLTVIIVAVNQIGKAFTLGYQRLPLRTERMTPDLPFGTTLPRGAYIVHVDAVGENGTRRLIFRARREHLPLRVE